jgi:hypothetical protein
MSNVYRMLTVTAWAAEMHISKQAGYVAVKRCRIPITDGKIDADAATMLYRNRTRYRVNPKRMASAPPPPPPAAPLSVAELIELAEGVAEVMMDDDGRPHIFAEGLPHLMNTLGLLARLDEDAVARVRLPQRVADAVCAWLDSTADEGAAGD